MLNWWDGAVAKISKPRSQVCDVKHSVHVASSAAAVGLLVILHRLLVWAVPGHGAAYLTGSTGRPMFGKLAEELKGRMGARHASLPRNHKAIILSLKKG